MATATLRINTEGGADLARALGALQGVTRRARAAVDAEERRSRAASAAADRARTAAASREAAARAAAERKALAAAQKAAKEASAIAQAEAKKRGKAAQEELKIAQRVAKAKFQAWERAEREATAVAASESRRRAALYQSAARASREAQARAPAGQSSEGSSRGRGVGGALIAFGREAVDRAAQVHGERQDARRNRALSQHTLNSAFYQAGAGLGTAEELRTMVDNFAQQNGVGIDVIADALNKAQTEFSVLGSSRTSQGERKTNLQAFLRNAELALNTYQDVGEVARVSGLLANSGLNAGQQQETLLALTGMAQRGAIELGAVTRTAMAPITDRMALAEQALGANASAASVSNARRMAAQQAFAEIEVGRSLGISPREMGQVTARLGNSLRSDSGQSNALQQRMLTNLQHDGSRGQFAIQKLFERGEGGQMRLRDRYQSALGLSGGLSEIFGSNTAAMQNVFAGSGQGNAQSLLTNHRRILSSLMSGGPEIQRLISGATENFTTEDVKRGEALRKGETLTEITRNDVNRELALTENTGALTRFSDSLNAWMSAHPVASTMLGGEKGAAAAMGLEAASNSVGARAATTAQGYGGGITGRIMAGLDPTVLFAGIRDAVMRGAKEGMQGAQVSVAVDPHAQSQSSGAQASAGAQR